MSSINDGAIPLSQNHLTNVSTMGNAYAYVDL